MIEILIFIAVVGLAGLLLWKKAKAADEKLHAERAQREAQLLAQALALRTATQKKNSSNDLDPL